jgi:hypothetical protein
VLERGSVPETLPGSATDGCCFQQTGDRILLKTRDSGKFLIEGGRRVVFEMHPHASESDVAAILTGVVFGIVLYRRRVFALHASAVEYDGKAVLFCGPAGVGKSILAAAFLQKGARFISDDLTCVAADGDTLCAVPGPACLGLWPDSLKALGDDASRYRKARPALEKRILPVANVAQGNVPVGTVFLLERNERNEKTGAPLQRPKRHRTAAYFEENTPLRSSFLEAEPAFPHFITALKLEKQAQIFFLNRKFHDPVLEESVSRMLDGLHGNGRRA